MKPPIKVTVTNWPEHNTSSIVLELPLGLDALQCINDEKKITMVMEPDDWAKFKAKVDGQLP